VIFAFRDFEFDEELWEIRRSGTPQAVPPKVMETIGILIRNRGRVVSKHELIAQLWPNVRVTEASLTKAIRIARCVLDDDGDAQGCIKTVRRRGYRFVTAVREREAAPASAVSREPRPSVAVPGGPPADDAFVAREAELSELGAALERAFAGRASFLLLAGDPGIGKTRLAEAFATRAEQRGSNVRWGRCCEEGGAPELRPWLQVFRGLLATNPTLLSAEPLLAKLLRICPATQGTQTNVEPWAVPRDEPERFRAFDAIANTLVKAAVQSPLLVILEDLHAADAASLLLTRFLVRQIKDVGVVVLGTYRPSDVVEPTLSKLMSDLVSEARVVPLTGLSEQDTRELVHVTLGAAPDAEFIARVQRITEGNPLFISEILRVTATHGRTGLLQTALEGLPAPARVVEALRGRVSAVPARTHELLSIAAVIGRDFDVSTLARVADATLGDVLRALQPALERKIVDHVHGSLDAYRFAHILLRDVL
jgi:predicted ATPase/DNA-binding winged helix-turn-helix (wHTH) protein